jgi:hypothetical protein
MYSKVMSECSANGRLASCSRAWSAVVSLRNQDRAGAVGLKEDLPY